MEENIFAYSVVTTGNAKWAWIGLNDIVSETKFVWSADNFFVNFTNWNREEPNNGLNYEEDEDCVYIGFNSTWNDSPCSTNAPLLCKYWL